MDKNIEIILLKKLDQFINFLCKKDASNKLQLDNKKFDLIMPYYYEYRERIHDSMNITVQPNDKEKKMDRHKVATAFFCSVMKAKPIKYIRTGTNPSFLERTVNEQLGFAFGLFIIDRFNKSKKAVPALDLEIFGLTFKLPECTGSHEKNYTANFTRLFKNDKIKDHLDFQHPSFDIDVLFLVSHIFFLIDSSSYYNNKGLLAESP